MYRLLVLFLFVLFFVPLNAQRMVKYVTFYPVPYGSHQRLNVTDNAIISGRDQGESVIAGKLAVPTSPTFEGTVLLDVPSGTQVFVGSGIRSGDVDTGTIYGDAYITGPDTSLENLDNVITNAYVADTANVNYSSIFDGKSLSDLPNCGDSVPSWKALRLKGSEECKYYLTCSGSGDTGCEKAPDLPECEFGPWIMATTDMIDTCGSSRRQGCIQTSACGASDRPCVKLREAVYSQIPTRFNCGMGKSLSQYCYSGSTKCTDANVSFVCRQHDGPKNMTVNGYYTAAEYCSFSTDYEATFWCRENPSKRGCLIYGNAASYTASLACAQSYSITSSSYAACRNATVNVGGYICQDGEDDATVYYRVCGGV